MTAAEALEDLMKMEHELTVKYLQNRNQENWDNLIGLRQAGITLEEQIEKKTFNN